MKIRYALSLVLLLSSNIKTAAYEGKEDIDNFFSKIVDINNPTYNELKALEEFIKFGNRPYLDKIFGPYTGVYNKRTARGMQFVNPNGEMPVHEVHACNVNLENKEVCIGLYASYNYPYPQKAKLLLSELKKSGYRGHILLRIGGYPNTQFGGLPLSHIPYSWKLATLLEMRNLGYKYVIWLDTAMHPLSNLEKLVQQIYRKGHFLCYAGFHLDYPYRLGQHLPHAVKALNVSVEQLGHIPHISSQLIGLDTENINIAQFLDTWLAQTLKVDSCITWYPEELCLSVAAWRHSLAPSSHFGNVVFTQANYDKRLCHTRYFFWDQHREGEPNWDPAVLDK